MKKRLMNILLCLAGSLITDAAVAQVAQQENMLKCYYRERQTMELTTLVNCAQRDEKGKLHFSPQLLKKADYSEGMTDIYMDKSAYYVKPDGRALEVIIFDNGPDGFAEGLVRSRVNGKIGYFNRRFEQVIPADYDFGWSFENGRALVCSGCQPQPDGEHTAMVGGLWGYIDKQGNPLAPFKPR
ncbi:WG repeat-containing protein [Pragia fontium]|uniref:WG repeat-containing protein n=1 Tax=Pragia fontium TaxID=82985 RepID=UPI00064966DE|nr:WG repeat-containing protein [Pragia fontium]AKJ43083.1 hypothetical protein QQ39_14260 [Pragia fontium]